MTLQEQVQQPIGKLRQQSPKSMSQKGPLL